MTENRTSHRPAPCWCLVSRPTVEQHLASGSVYLIKARGTGCALPRRGTESRICARSPGSAQPSFSGRSRKTEPAVQGTGEWALRLRAQECVAWGPESEGPLCQGTNRDRSAFPLPLCPRRHLRWLSRHMGGGVVGMCRSTRGEAPGRQGLGPRLSGHTSCSSKMQALTCELTLTGELLLRKPQGC